MAKRSGKFYYKNEKQIMERLGFKQTKGSGSGWIEKEDGENENCICQLKSTDANSIRIDKLDIEKLLYHADVSHKLPVFVIQFIKDDSTYILVRPEDIQEITEYIKTGKTEGHSLIDIETEATEVLPSVKKTKIRSGGNARKRFTKENEKKYKKGLRSAT